MSRTMQIRFKGGPKDGCVLRVPVYTKIADTIARYAVPLVGHYEIITRSPAGEHVIVAWNDGSTGAAVPLVPAGPAADDSVLRLASTLESLAKQLRTGQYAIKTGNLNVVHNVTVSDGRTHAVDVCVISDIVLEDIGNLNHGY